MHQSNSRFYRWMGGWWGPDIACNLVQCHCGYCYLWLHIFKINTANLDKGNLTDSGANCWITANLSALSDVTELAQPIVIGLAVTNDGSVKSSSECTHIDRLTIKCDGGLTFKTSCFYNPNASDTIISPQAIIDESNKFTQWSQTGRKLGQAGQINFTGPNGTKSITFQQHDGLYLHQQ